MYEHINKNPLIPYRVVKKLRLVNTEGKLRHEVIYEEIKIIDTEKGFFQVKKRKSINTKSYLIKVKKKLVENSMYWHFNLVQNSLILA